MTALAPLRRVEQLMGMPVSLAVRGRADGVDEAWRAVLAELREVDAVFSTWRPDSVVSRLGRGEIGLADCPPEVAEVLRLADQAEAESAGAFSVRLPGGLDPSGVVKGWAVERAARHLGGFDFSLSAGGDLVCATPDPAAGPWRVGIEDPHDPGRIVAVVPVHNGAVATSGLAHRGAHVVDPRTGTTPRDLAGVTVIDRSLTSADIDATAALVLGHEAPEWLRSRQRTALLVWADGRRELISPTTRGA